MTFHIHELHQKTKREILEVWEIALEHMDSQDKEIERLKSALTPEVVEFVRCGVGSNYGGKYYEEKIKSVHEPLVELLKELNK